MSPVSMLMLHNPSTFAWGDCEEMLRAKAMLDEVKESILNAYELKTGLSRDKLSGLMDAETWMNVHKALELGFADKIMFADTKETEKPTYATLHNVDRSILFSRAAVTASLLDRIKPVTQQKTQEPKGISVQSLEKRLQLILHN